ncbi:hypothetical protein FE782_00820 [Paenibacillus antri]|uniref:Dynamin-like helical domain-containing protein n=1 Tax=Paenibacillus antri TaxID=2582848 RepID=A0A5R9GKC1_9BACL|nr:LeoA/HP0731 family dynamin-like GTPase [Paenibacillus antri]TLS53928.1 hypothetical protein FE782_00820 [Paenibacillus antri]
MADLDDDKDYVYHSNIKREVVTNTLQGILPTNMEPRVVCVSGNPFDQGLDYWLTREEEYNQLSRLPYLIQALQKFIDTSKTELTIKAGVSVVQDAVQQLRLQLQGMKDQLAAQIEVSQNQGREIEKTADKLQRDISKKHLQIKEEIITLRQDVMVYLNGAPDRKQLQVRIQERLGQEGYILRERINLIIQKYTEQLSSDQKQLLKEVETSIKFHNQLQDQILEWSKKMGVNLASHLNSQSTRAIADSIIKLRDMSNLGIKFKPWGAMKWASRVTKFAAWLPVIFDTITTIKKIYDEQKLEGDKQKLSEELEELFRGFFDSFTLEEYADTYFKPLKGTLEVVNSIKKSIDDYIELLAKIEQAINDLEQQ